MKTGIKKVKNEKELEFIEVRTNILFGNTYTGVYAGNLNALVGNERRSCPLLLEKKINGNVIVGSCFTSFKTDSYYQWVIMKNNPKFKMYNAIWEAQK